MQKTVNIDFYKVVMPDTVPNTFHAFLARIAQVPIQDEARSREITGDPVRLQQLQHQRGHLEGDMVRTTMDTRVLHFLGEILRCHE